MWGWKTKKTLFGFLVVPMVLYGCKDWGSNTLSRKWRQIERLQKHLITHSLKIKSTSPYEIILDEVGAFPIEASTMFHPLSYLRRLDNMESHRWPKMAASEKLDRRKSMWMKQNVKWMSKWGISISECPNHNGEIKNMGRQNSKKACGKGHLGGKRNTMSNILTVYMTIHKRLNRNGNKKC